MSGTTVFGFQCKIYVDMSEDPEDPNFAELVEVIDAVLSMQFVEADASCRQSGGLEVVEPSLLQVEVTGKLQWRNDGANALTPLNILRSRANIRTSFVARVLTGTDIDANARGMWGEWKITKWAYAQELKELSSVEFAMKPIFGTYQLVEEDVGVPLAALDTEAEPEAEPAEPEITKGILEVVE